jgi:hypothetical protein
MKITTNLDSFNTPYGVGAEQELSCLGQCWAFITSVISWIFCCCFGEPAEGAFPSPSLNNRIVTVGVVDDVPIVYRKILEKREVVNTSREFIYKQMDKAFPKYCVQGNKGEPVATQALQPYLKQVRLFEGSKKYRFSKTQLLGCFDVCTTPYFLEGENQNPFYLNYAVPIDVRTAGSVDIVEELSDRNRYRNDYNNFMPNLYRDDMELLYQNLFQVQTSLGCSDAVWTAFGVKTYGVDDEETTRRLAQGFYGQLKKYPDLKIHLCLNSEEGETRKAFEEMLKEESLEFRARVFLYINVEPVEIAQEIANEKGAYKVSLVNGTNRSFFGDTWWTAMNKEEATEDRMIHACSPLAIGIAQMLNGGDISTSSDNPHRLKERILAFGGKVEALRF